MITGNALDLFQVLLNDGSTISFLATNIQEATQLAVFLGPSVLPQYIVSVRNFPTILAE